jgi:hypothetical protein
VQRALAFVIAGLAVAGCQDSQDGELTASKSPSTGSTSARAPPSTWARSKPSMATPSIYPPSRTRLVGSAWRRTTSRRLRVRQRLLLKLVWNSPPGIVTRIGLVLRLRHDRGPRCGHRGGRYRTRAGRRRVAARVRRVGPSHLHRVLRGSLAAHRGAIQREVTAVVSRCPVQSDAPGSQGRNDENRPRGVDSAARAPPFCTKPVRPHVATRVRAGFHFDGNSPCPGRSRTPGRARMRGQGPPTRP